MACSWAMDVQGSEIFSGNVHSSQAGWNDKLYIITAVVSLYLPGGRHRFRPLSRYFLADRVHKIDCPEMLYLSVCARN